MPSFLELAVIAKQVCMSSELGSCPTTSFHMTQNLIRLHQDVGAWKQGQRWTRLPQNKVEWAIISLTQYIFLKEQFLLGKLSLKLSCIEAKMMEEGMSKLSRN